MAKGPTPKSDALRAMREARFAENQRQARTKAPTQADVDAMTAKKKTRKKKEEDK